MAYTITVQIRNARGEPTGKTRTIECESAAELAEQYNRYSVAKPRKKKNPVEAKKK